MEILLDARRLSRSWLAVYVAAERRPGWAPPSMVRTVHIEFYEDRGVRLMSTDGGLLMKAWVPFAEWEPEPGPEDHVDVTATAHDVDDRLSGLMGYLADLTNPKGSDDPPEIEVSLGLLTEVDDGEHRLSGLDPKYVTLNYPGREIVRVRAMEVVQPDWRAAMHNYTPDATYDITVNPHDMRRVARVAAWVNGPVKFEFEGTDGAMRLSWPKADPLHLVGMVLPVRHWRVIAREPEPEVAPELLDITERSLEDLAESGLAADTEVQIGGKTFKVDADGAMVEVTTGGIAFDIPVGDLSAVLGGAAAAILGLDEVPDEADPS